MRLAGRLAFFALAALFFTWAVLEPELSTSARTTREPAATTVTVMPPDDSPAIPDENSQAADAPEAGGSETDLYGNEVSDAVAEYKLDSAGSLYEMHAPQVEVPKLTSPKS